jgi:hypothetical protein
MTKVKVSLKTTAYVIATTVIFAIAGCFGLLVHKSVPYFAVIAPERFKSWRPAPYVPAGTGNTWKLSQYLEDGGSYNADVDHYVLQRDGKAYDLINSRDTWGFGNASSWNIDLIGDQLYVFDAHHVSPGWFRLTVGQRGWLIDRLGFGPEGSFQVIPPQPAIALPQNPPRGGLFRLENNQLRYVGAFTKSDDLLEHVENGDYYLAPPGTGVRKVIDLKETPATR